MDFSGIENYLLITLFLGKLNYIHFKQYYTKPNPTIQVIEVNPLLPNVPQREHLVKNLILILERIIKKFSYERRDYESVDEKSLS